jgi:hypothetical protein
MFQPSVPRRTRIVTVTLLGVVAHLLVFENGWTEHVSAATIDYSVTRVDHAESSDDTGAYEALNPAQALSAHFTGDEVRVRSSGEREWQLGLRLTGWGYGEHLPAVTSGRMTVRGNRVEIRKQALAGPQSSPLVEWYVNTPRGLEQGFTLSAPPDTIPYAGAPGRLRIALELTGDLRGEATEDGQTVLLKDQHGRRLASYDHLKAWDATGRELESRMRVHGRGVSLEVNDTGATYPVTIDPMLTQEIILEDDTGLAFDKFGSSVAISGNTAIVAAINRGAAYIFVRNGATWELQQKLPPVDAPNEGFGQSVAISGNTAIVGATATDGGRGVAYVFVRVGTTWSQEKILTASDRAVGDHFGYSVGISGDIAVVGAPYRNGQRGAAYVFVRSGTTWAEQQQLFAIAGEANDGFGWSVAVSVETLIVGAFGDNVVGDTLNREGSAYVFVRNGTTWSSQAFLTADDVTFSFGFGWSVSVSGDIALVGTQPGYAAFVFTRSGTAWSSAQPLLPAPGEALTGDGYGEAVSISGDRAIVGAFNSDKGRGAAYVFARNAGTWSEQTKLRAVDAPAGTGSAESSFGSSVAISGPTDIVGAPYKQVETERLQGGAYVFPSLDTDGDGLPDDWETNGVTIDGVFVDLPAMGANPLHKDIFVHVDWMGPDPARPGVIFKPERRAIKIVIDAFAIAPVDNPDHRPGVNLHVDLGPTSVLSYVTGATTTWGALSRAGEVPFQATIGSFNPNKTYNWSGVDAVKALHFLPAKRSAVFHYALFANNFSPVQNGGISRGLNAADFIVTLGDWPDEGGTLLEQAGTFMHEFGHNLGLHHGGDDDVNNKPNYLSNMNYSFSNVGVFQPNGKQRSFDYSRALLPQLDERSLDEFVGINDPAMHLTFWSTRTRPDIPEGSNHCFPNPSVYFKLFFPTDGLDWNCDGIENPIPVAADINGDGACIDFGDNLITDSTPGGDDVEVFGRIMSGPNRICETIAAGDDAQEHLPGFAQPDVLTGFNDWPAIVFDGGGSIGGLGVSASEPLSTANDEPTLKQILDVVPAGVFEEELVAPLDVVSVSTQAGPAPLLVGFDGSASTAVNATIVDWAWDFGDGTTGSGTTVPHTYNLPGEYFASVTVTDSNGHVNLVPLLQHVEVIDGTIVTATPLTTPTLIPTPTRTTTPPPGATPTRTATPLPGSTPTPAPTPTPSLGLVVTTTNDNGDNANPIPGSLRQTILTANAKANPVGGVDVITFAIPGAGVHTIAPVAFPLPWITDPVTIDGYTQPGASPNTQTVGDDAVLLIELAPDVPGGYGFVLRGAGGSTVRGIVINRYRNVGILVDSDDNVVEGCFIGTNAAGDSRLIPVFTNSDEAGLVQGGIYVISGANNRFGGTLPAARNVIVGNGEFGGIRVGNDVYRGVADTRIQGNYLGTNAAGSAALNVGGINNGGPGVEINDLKVTNTLIGGTEPGAGNLISGNQTEGGGFGILIYASGDVTIQGNLIGTNAQGTAAIGNASGGIFAGGIFGGPVGRLVIGGPQPGARNVISGNGVDGLNGQQVVSAGIALSTVVPAVVQGNFIGTGSDGVTLIPNFVHGIGVTVVSTTRYTIGGTHPGEGNVIAGNARHGINVGGDPTGPVTILGNSFFSNGGLSAISGGLGINLTGSSPEDGFRVTGNDPCDADVGPNGGQNYPELTTADDAAGATTIAATLDSTPGTQFPHRVLLEPGL